MLAMGWSQNVQWAKDEIEKQAKAKAKKSKKAS